MIAATNRIYRYDGTNLVTELNNGGGGTATLTDVATNSSGRVFVGFHGGQNFNGVWTSPTGNGSWTRIAENGNPTGWDSCLLYTSPSPRDQRGSRMPSSA